MTLMTVCVLGKLTYTVNIHLQLYNYMHAAALDVGHYFFPKSHFAIWRWQAMALEKVDLAW